MTPNQYQVLALQTEAPQEPIRERIYQAGVQATRLEGAARGLSDEAGELSGAVKRWLEYGRPLDRTNVVEECGDVMWRVCQALKAVDATLEDAMIANLRKLAIRYNEGYTDHRAADENRDRKGEAQAVAETA